MRDLVDEYEANGEPNLLRSTLAGCANTKTCEHKHTGSCSPSGVYLYVRCMDCGDLLAVSEEGRNRLARCPGYNPKKQGHERACQNCGFDYWDHVPNVQYTP